MSLAVRSKVAWDSCIASRITCSLWPVLAMRITSSLVREEAAARQARARTAANANQRFVGVLFMPGSPYDSSEPRPPALRSLELVHHEVAQGRPRDRLRGVAEGGGGGPGGRSQDDGAATGERRRVAPKNAIQSTSSDPRQSQDASSVISADVDHRGHRDLTSHPI